MELTAAIKGLEALNTKCQVNLITDSKYVMDGINSWINGWKKNNWKNSQKKDVKNKDLWIQLDKLNSYHDVNGHGLRVTLVIFKMKKLIN